MKTGGVLPLALTVLALVVTSTSVPAVDGGNKAVSPDIPILRVACLELAACDGLALLATHGSIVPMHSEPKLAPHPGIDYGAPEGTPVIAAADGEVIYTNAGSGECGVSVLIAHVAFLRYTVYCHLSRPVVWIGQQVKRGELIGYVGPSDGSRPTPYLHFEFCTYPCTSGHWALSSLTEAGTVDPLGVLVGCFDQKGAYPTERFALIHPVPCKN